MKKIICFIALLLAMKSFSQTSNVKPKIDTESKTNIATLSEKDTVLTKADSAEITNTNSLSLANINALEEYIKGIATVKEYEVIKGVLQLIKDIAWQRAEAIRKQKPK